MAVNYPGPYELEIIYSVTLNSLLLEHKQRLNLALASDPTIGTAFGSIAANKRGGSTVNLASAVDAYIDLVYPIWDNSDCAIDTCNLYKVADGSYDKTFISAYTITTPAGTAGTTIGAGSERFSFRTFEGGSMSLVFLETIFSAFGKFPYSGLGALGQQDLVDFVLSTDNWILARDTSYPASFIRGLHGQNESVFKKRYR